MGAVASLGLLASCSSDDDLSTGGNGKDGLQQIKIGMGVQANVATRGTGTVGAVGEKENTWANQTVNVYMLNKGTLDLAMFGEDPIYENTVLTTPTDNASGIATELVGGVAQYKYYPTTKTAFDFWGYRLDDANDTTATNQEGSATAAAIENNKFVPYISGDSLLIGFKIDGTQDIMAGKAVPTEEEIRKCGGGEDNIYSAFAARRDVQPNIKFEHLLSRLNFQVLDGKKTATTDPDKAVKVTGITVKSKATGKLVIAYQGAETTFENVSDQLIVDKDADSEKDAALLKELKVKQRAEGAPLTQNLEDLTPVTPAWNNGMAMATQVGEALLAIPAKKYEITINLKQKVQVKGDKGTPQEGDFEEKEYTYEADLNNTVNPEKGFEPGYSYNVTITVYGLSEIQITTTLIPWNDGGNIEMNPEDETFGETTTNNAYEWVKLEGDPTLTGATAEKTTYESFEALKEAVAANASNSGKIYKVGTGDPYEYYQCKVKVVTPPAPAATYTLDEYTFQEGVDNVEASYDTKEKLDADGVATAENEGNIYKVGTEESGYKYYKVTKHTSGE
ncbi:putative uncharacterized protein [Prevotella sp. CAG:1092]|nr:putative uncharacterized protein [Prevotella sp. CAG:1092]